MNVHDIWPFEGGITDLPDGWPGMVGSELGYVRELWLREREAMDGNEQMATFVDRMAREWAIEAGVIENLYELDRGVTQTLIEQGFQSALLEHGSTNKPREYVIRLLQDQKDALEGLFSFVKQERTLGTSYIKELHAAMTQGQVGADSVDPQGRRTQIELLRGEWKRWPNYPVRNDVELPYCPPEHTAAEMDRLIAMHSQHRSSGVPSEIEAAWLHHRFTQIHPFQDGNGRVARALASLVFMQDGLFPLVVTRDDKIEYLDALEVADGGDLGALVGLFTRLQKARYRRAANLADKIQRPASSLDEALQGLVRTVGSRQLNNGATKSRVIDLRDLIQKHLASLVSKAESSIRGVDSGFEVLVRVSLQEDADKFLESARDTGANAFGILAIRPCAWAAVEFRVPDDLRMVFHVSAVDPTIEGLVQAIAFSVDGSRFPPVLCEEPLEWYPQEDDSAIVGRVDDWVERAFIRALEVLRKYL